MTIQTPKGQPTPEMSPALTRDLWHSAGLVSDLLKLGREINDGVPTTYDAQISDTESVFVRYKTGADWALNENGTRLVIKQQYTDPRHPRRHAPHILLPMS